MNAVVESVRSLWVPLDGINLLVPNVAIAEVINYQPLDLIQDGPEWLLGSLRWRDQELPVISMESLCGRSLPQAEKSARISIINSVQARSEMPFYAMVTASIPRLIHADADALGESLAPVRTLPNSVADCVQIGNEEALIPDLDIVQSVVASAWKRFRN
jgi:chemosensory pili system protein ChpC